MRVLVIGSHGKVGRHVVRLLHEAGHEARAMIRDADQTGEMRMLGGDPVLADLEDDITHAMRGARAVVFTAGSGGHTGPDKTKDVDRDGALLAIETAEELGVDRFVMVSAMNADDPGRGNEKIRHYLEAKKIADDRLMASSLDYVIVRPGRLSDDPGTGKVRVGSGLGSGEVPREDVAAVVVTAIEEEAASRSVFELLSGETPIAEAVRSLG